MKINKAINLLNEYWRLVIRTNKLKTAEDVTDFCLTSYDVPAFESTNNKTVTTFVLEIARPKTRTEFGDLGIIEYDPNALSGAENQFIVKGLVAYPYVGSRKNLEKWADLWDDMRSLLHHIREMPCRSEKSTNAWKRIMASAATSSMRVVNAHLYVQPNGSIKKL